MKRGHLTIQRRPLLRGAAGRREPWLKLANVARTNAEHAAGTSFGSTYEAVASPARPTPLEQLRFLRRECPAGSWPVDGYSSGQVAEAFLAIVDAFASEHTPAERRCQFAELLRAAATQVIALLDEQNAAEATHVARRYGD